MGPPLYNSPIAQNPSAHLHWLFTYSWVFTHPHTGILFLFWSQGLQPKLATNLLCIRAVVPNLPNAAMLYNTVPHVVMTLNHQNYLSATS